MLTGFCRADSRADGRLAGRVRLCGVHAAVAQAAVVADKAFVAEIAAVF